MKEGLGSLVAPHEEMQKLMKGQSPEAAQAAVRPSNGIPNLEKATLGVSE